MSSPALVEFPKRHREFIIEAVIMPRREVHILAGASGIGKTTFLVQMIDDLIEGNNVFEQATHPIKPVYVCNDRSYDDVLRTFERISPRNQYPIYSMLTSAELKNCHSVFEAIRHVKTLHADCDFIVFDPISQQVENVNSSKEVGTLFKRLTTIAQELNVTILIVHHTAKTKTDAIYANPRQRMSGCMAWGGYSNLNLIFEEAQEADPTHPIRTLYVCPRNGANLKLRFIQDENGCFLAAPETKKEKTTVAQQHAAFNQMEFGEFTLSECFDRMGQPSDGAIHRRLAQYLKLNCIEKVLAGKYRKVKNFPLKTESTPG